MSQLDFQRFLEAADRDIKIADQIVELDSDSAKLIELGKKHGFNFTEKDLSDFRQSIVDSFNHTVQQIRQTAEAAKDSKLLDYARYLQLTGEDIEFAEKVAKAGPDIDRIVSLAKEKNLVFDRKTFEKANEIISSMDDDELTDEDLDNVAGGIVTAGIALGAAAVGCLGAGAVGAGVGLGLGVGALAGAGIILVGGAGAVAGAGAMGVGVGALAGVAMAGGGSNNMR